MPSWESLLQKPFFEANARERALGIVDDGSFFELLSPFDRFSSPHLPPLDSAVAFDDGVVIGVGLINRHPIFLVSFEGRFIGGSIGEVSGAKMLGMMIIAKQSFQRLKDCNKLCQENWPIVVISFDTGGVRLQEANAGLLALSEIMDALQDLRDKVPVVSLIGGKIGCFGGMGFVAAATDVVLMSEYGRLGLAGPEVIEQELGKEEFDSSDKGLVYRTTGGKHKFIIQDCNYLVGNEIDSFRTIITNIADMPMGEIKELRRIGSPKLVNEQIELVKTIVDWKVKDSLDVWSNFGNENPIKLSDMSRVQFLKKAIRRPRP